MAATFSFSEEDMEIDEGLGYPKAYAKLCRNPHLFNAYNQGPPFAYSPYILHSQKASRASELNQFFPVIDGDRKPSANPSSYVNLLWKQLNHLGNAGFDPAKFRVDMYGNVLFFHADSGSPLAWEIDHWFPCSRGGKTVPSNLKLLQWQVCKRKQNNLEFLIPWWDLQLGVSVNQFLSIIASANSDFRNRAFRWLFSEGENEELNDSQAVESHIFPPHFIESEQKVGLAPAAIVLLQRDIDASTLQSLDLNRPLRSNSPMTARKDDRALSKAIQRYRPSVLKENDQFDVCNNQHFILDKAWDSLKHREETEKMQLETQQLDDELNEMKQKNDVERLALQDLESLLIKRRRRAEKCRRLAESQSSYRALLEKMIGDAVHQSIVYKEQIRLNQAANNALMARLEAQKAICSASEKELHKRFKQREEIENQMRPEQARKRLRIDDTALEEICNRTSHLLSSKKSPLQKELRLFLEDEQKASEAALSLDEKEKEIVSSVEAEIRKEDFSLTVPEDETALDDELQKLATGDENSRKTCKKEIMSSLGEVDEQYRHKIGKGNVERWLQILLDNTHEEESSLTVTPPHKGEKPEKKNNKIDGEVTWRNPQEKIKILGFEESQEKAHGSNLKCSLDEEKDLKRNKLVGIESSKLPERKRPSEVGIACKGIGSSKSYERKERGLVRCESARSFRPFPPSPSVILGMRKGVDCIRKKPMVMGDDEDEVDDDEKSNGQQKIFH
ncbi:titin [Cinnamomum micranthum f. kanehirae]|uniref:Titin n=1 Tax=Cinnamomum micranthum f. kanehirae TaxID=337451 RepID=A0A3S3M4S8_9MAGN|nr:titin [Cinnamomum micranthum f. kanehirae]